MPGTPPPTPVPSGPCITKSHTPPTRNSNARVVGGNPSGPHHRDRCRTSVNAWNTTSDSGPIRSVHHEGPHAADAELERPRGGGEPIRSPPPRQVPHLGECLEHHLRLRSHPVRASRRPTRRRRGTRTPAWWW